MSSEQADVPAGPSSSNTDSGMGFVWMGALLVLVSWVVFELIAGDYFVTTVALVIAAVLVVLPRLAPKAVAAVAPLPVFTKVGGYALAITGVVELLEDLRFEHLDGFVSILGGLIAYGGYALAFIGARAIED